MDSDRHGHSYPKVSEIETHDRSVFFKEAAKYVEPGQKVLDAGCGDDGFAKAVGRAISMLDNNEYIVSELSKRYGHVKHGSITDMPYENDYFSVIHCSHVVEHLQAEDVYAFMKEAKRCLKRGGYLIISAPMMWSGFYDDLSHVRPYNPKVFGNYLCSKDNETSPRTRRLIGGFKKIELIYRVRTAPDGEKTITGYTLVLKKVK